MLSFALELTSAYGAAGSLIVVLMWVYYSAQILFFGAKFTQVYSNKYGSHLQPASGAEPMAWKKVAIETHHRNRRHRTAAFGVLGVLIAAPMVAIVDILHAALQYIRRFPVC